MLKSQMMKLVVFLLFIEVGMILSFTPINIASRPVRRELMADKRDHYLICKHKPLEIGIVLDSSASISNTNFKTAKAFLQDFLKQYEISSRPNGVRVSMITYGQGVYQEIGFNLTTYSTSDEVINAIGKIPHRVGRRTDTGTAINFMRNYQLAESIVRPRVPKVSIVITDGESQETKETKKAAEDARNDGIVLFAIGVGRISDSELLNIAGNSNRVFKVDKHENLNTIKEDLAYQTCFVCKHKPLEIGIVLDSSASISNTNFKTAKAFLQDFLNQYEISSKPNGVRVSIITYGQGVYAEIGFNLTTYSTSDEVINAIDKIPHRVGRRTDTGTAINFMRNYLLAESIVRPGVPKVSIVITDGESQETKETKKAAEDARNDGIVLFAIGVGRISDSELLNIAGNSKRVFKVDKHENLNTIKEDLAYHTCFVSDTAIRF